MFLLYYFNPLAPPSFFGSFACFRNLLSLKKNKHIYYTHDSAGPVSFVFWKSSNRKKKKKKPINQYANLPDRHDDGVDHPPHNSQRPFLDRTAHDHRLEWNFRRYARIPPRLRRPHLARLQRQSHDPYPPDGRWRCQEIRHDVHGQPAQAKTGR